MNTIINELTNLLAEYDGNEDNSLYRLKILHNIRQMCQNLMDKADELAQEIEKEIDYVSTDS